MRAVLYRGLRLSAPVRPERFAGSVKHKIGAAHIQILRRQQQIVRAPLATRKSASHLGPLSYGLGPFAAVCV
jgi:hypothetical protein